MLRQLIRIYIINMRRYNIGFIIILIISYYTRLCENDFLNNDGFSPSNNHNDIISSEILIY